MRIPQLALVGVMVASPVAAQVAWQPLTTTNQPPTEPDGLGYDGATQRVLWCGSNPAAGVVEVWA